MLRGSLPHLLIALVASFEFTRATGGAGSPSVQRRWSWLNTNRQGILYAPTVGKNPIKADLFSDTFTRWFERDAVLMHEMGASTIVLEPEYVKPNLPDASFYQGLFNATNFIPQDYNSLDLIMQQQTDTRRHWDPLNVVPSITLEEIAPVHSPPTNPMRVIPYDLHEYCQYLRHFAQRMLTPAPAKRALLFGEPYGGGANYSKENVQAFNLHLLPNDGKLWDMRMPGSPGVDQIASLSVVDLSAGCLKDALTEWADSHGDGRPTPPVLVTLSAEPCGTCIKPNDFIPQYAAAIAAAFAPPPSSPPQVASHHSPPPAAPPAAPSLPAAPVDGFIIKLPRGGCDASDYVTAVLGAEGIHQFAENLWFSVGCDAYDTQHQGEYPPCSATVVSRGSMPSSRMRVPSA